MLDLLKECEGARRIGISGHVRPDGDCVGSCLAMRMYLKKAFPEAAVQVYLETPPEIFAQIRGFEEIITNFPAADPYDVFIVLDCEPSRTGNAQKYYEAASKKINIDHHISNTASGELCVIRPQIGSVCEVVLDLMDRTLIDADIALSLYIGIIHDTGVLQYSNTSPDTLNKVAYLIGFGFDFPRIIEETFYQKTYLQAQIMGRALMESIRFMDGRCIVSVIPAKVMEFYGVISADFEGIVNQLRNIKGVDCAIFMYQIGDLEYKVSLRTTNAVDASKVAANFGGGGHARAAGCIMRGTFHDCVNNLSRHIEEQLCITESST